MYKIFIFSPDESLVEYLRQYFELSWIQLYKLEPIEEASINTLKYMDTCGNIVFTSPRTIKFLLSDAKKFGIYKALVDKLLKSKIFAIGPQTASTIRSYLNEKPVIIPEEYDSYGLVKRLIEEDLECIVLPRSSAGLKIINHELNKHGIKVYEVHVYRPVLNKDGINQFVEGLGEKNICILTSPLISETVYEVAKEYGDKEFIFVFLGNTSYQRICGRIKGKYKVYVGDGKRYSINQIVKSIIE